MYVAAKSLICSCSWVLMDSVLLVIVLLSLIRLKEIFNIASLAKIGIFRFISPAANDNFSECIDWVIISFSP